MKLPEERVSVAPESVRVPVKVAVAGSGVLVTVSRTVITTRPPSASASTRASVPRVSVTQIEVSASRPTSPGPECAESMSRSWVAEPMAPPPASRSTVLPTTSAEVSARPSTIDPARVVRVTSPVRESTASTRRSSTAVGIPSISVRKALARASTNRSPSARVPSRFDESISRKFDVLPTPPSGVKMEMDVPTTSASLSPDVAVASAPVGASTTEPNREVSTTSPPRDRIIPARRSPSTSVRVTSPSTLVST